VHYSGSEERAEEVAERITSSGGRVVTVGGDVGEPDDVATLFDATTAAFGGLDVVVNAAGVMPLPPISEMDVETFDRVVRVNLRGTFLVSRTAARQVRSGGATRCSRGHRPGRRVPRRPRSVGQRTGRLRQRRHGPDIHRDRRRSSVAVGSARLALATTASADTPPGRLLVRPPHPPAKHRFRWRRDRVGETPNRLRSSRTANRYGHLVIDDAARCGYSRCRAELPAPGPQGGRRRSFCRDTRWEGGRTCAQMARGERDALDALGLDGGGTAFRLDADRLREHVEAVRVPVGALAEALDAVSARLEEVQRDAVGAVEVAHRRAAESDAERVAAEAARERADAAVARHRETTERAGAERDEAVRRAAGAARQALEATEALGAARQAAEEAAAARQAAEGRAAAVGERAEQRVARAEQAAADAVRRAERTGAERDAAVARAAELRDELATLRDTLDRLQGEAAERRARAAAQEADARDRLAAAERRGAESARVAAQEADARRAAEGGLRAALERVESEASLRARADAERDRSRAELEAARAELAAARLRALAPDELRAVLAEALAASPPST
jgi:hypothetical protein